jgi:eukaryotic-like serine/threonine-protein kinase
MGVVDLATGPDGSPVALKRVALAGRPDQLALARARIRREADVLRRLSHPGIVRLLDVLEDGDDLVLVMPYLPGGSLADRVARWGPLPPGEVAWLALHLLDALATAHRAGVVHRDVKPANVLFDGSGRPLLADFGVAATADATAGLTVHGWVVGTAEFMAPEQARGAPPGPAADVFSLGATLVHAATGRSPYGAGEPYAVLLRAASGRIDPLPRSLPRGLRRLLGSMLERQPERRPSAAALLGGPGGTRPRRQVTARRGEWAKSAALVVAMVAACLGLAVATVAAVRAVAGGEEAAGAAASPTTTTTVAPSTVPPCTDLPYQPCGQPAAPNTDGRRCTGETADYDGRSANGCEAEPDGSDGAVLGDRLTANLVPAADTDAFRFEVEDGFQVFCDGAVTVTLTAAPGVAQRLEVVRDGDVLGTAVSADGAPAEVRVRESDCGGDDGGTYEARVTSVGSDRSAGEYVLERSGHL